MQRLAIYLSNFVFILIAGLMFSQVPSVFSQEYHMNPLGKEKEKAKEKREELSPNDCTQTYPDGAGLALIWANSLSTTSDPKEAARIARIAISSPECFRGDYVDGVYKGDIEYLQSAGNLVLATSEFRLGDYQSVIAAYLTLRGIQTEYGRSEGDYILLGYSYLMVGDYANGLGVFEEGSKIFPGSQDLYYWSLTTALADGGQDEVEKVWDRRSYGTDKYPKLGSLVVALTTIAEKAEKQDLTRAALIHYSHVFGIMTTFDDLVKFNQDPGNSRNLIQNSYGLKAWLRALFLYKQIRPKPEVPLEAINFARLAEADVAASNASGAAGHYFQAIQAAPWWPDAYFNLALAMRASNMYAKDTIPVMQRYIDLAPDGRFAGKAKATIEDWRLHPDVPLRTRIISH